VDGDGIGRCEWAAPERGADPLMVAYHDEEWGAPVADDGALFERLSLEIFQAGLSWSLILRRRAGFCSAFDGFDPAAVAAFGPGDVDRLLVDAGIVRNRAKVEATIANARAVLELVSRAGSFAAWLAAELPRPAPVLPAAATMASIPSRTEEAIRLTRELQRHGFRFVGPTIVYSFMESVGLVDDHVPGCFRYRGHAGS
jgi:DNA-3-methyladenine glycosylase I